MSRAPQATATARAERARRHALPRRNPREPLTAIIEYRGGAECWWQVTSRGVTWRVPGHTAVHDLFAAINRIDG